MLRCNKRCSSRPVLVEHRPGDDRLQSFGAIEGVVIGERLRIITSRVLQPNGPNTPLRAKRHRAASRRAQSFCQALGRLVTLRPAHLTRLQHHESAPFAWNFWR
jgi:hypothetical protein